MLICCNSCGNTFIFNMNFLNPDSKLFTHCPKCKSKIKVNESKKNEALAKW